MSVKTVLARAYRDAPPSAFPVAVSQREGQFLAGLVQCVRPKILIEAGLGYGLSALWLEYGPHRPDMHVIVDPFPDSYQSFGKKLIRKSGLKIVSLVTESSQEYFASLIETKKESIDMIFLDANERFDGCMTDMYFVTKLLRPGGVVAIRNMWNPSVRKASWFYYKNLPYSLMYCPSWINQILRKMPIVGILAFRALCKFNLLNYCILQKTGADNRQWDHFIPF